MRIGSIEIPQGAALAPMAGVSDPTMRRLCARYGAVFTVSEMVSAKALTMGDKKTKQLMAGGGDGAPYGVQLFSHEPDVLFEAVQRIEDVPFDFLDVNMGCPAPKIVGHGAGSGLLRAPKIAGEMAQAAVRASKTRPVTVKLRIGWDDTTHTGLEVAQRCEAAGVAMLVVHARTRAQMYIPGVDYEAVAQIKRAVKIPVLFNGDIDSADMAAYALGQSGCDGVMVGRGAQGNPWLFREIHALMAGEAPPVPPTLRERMAVLDEQVRGMCEEKGEARAMREARGVAGAFMHALRGAAALRRQAHALCVYTDLAPLIARAYDENLQVSAHGQ